MWTAGCVYTDEQFTAAATASADSDGPVGVGTVLRGVAASPGVVRARARLVHDPLGVELRSEVLVAHRTDPGWVPLFPSAVAVVVERGSVLSHSAIVAREFGIPCVVALRDVLSQLRDGDEIEVDGGAGTVTVVATAEDRS
jgi:pyruvate,water dikinase